MCIPPNQPNVPKLAEPVLLHKADYWDKARAGIMAVEYLPIEDGPPYGWFIVLADGSATIVMHDSPTVLYGY